MTVYVDEACKRSKFLQIARCSFDFVAVAFGKDLLFTGSYSHHIPLVFAGLQSPQTGGRPVHVAPLKTCMRSAHEVRTRSFTQPLAPEMVGCPIVASWRVDPGGLRLVSTNAWQKVPQWLHDELSDVFSSFDTKDVKDGFNFTRRRVPLAVSGTMQPLAQWHNLAQSNLQKKLVGSPFPSSRRIATCTRELSACLLSRLQKKTLSASGRNSSENRWPRRTGTRLRLQTSARMSTGPRHKSNSNWTLRCCRSCSAQSFYKLGRSACTATICLSRPLAGFCAVQQWAHWL